MADWTDEDIRECYRDEVAQRFEFENYSHREVDARELAKLSDSDRAMLPEHMRSPTNSLFHEIYERTTIELDRNVATITLPEHGYAIGRRFLRMFDNAEVAWCELAIWAKEERIIGQVTLVDSWDDERSAAWRHRHPFPPKFCDWGRFEDRELQYKLAAAQIDRLARHLQVAGADSRALAHITQRLR